MSVSRYFSPSQIQLVTDNYQVGHHVFYHHGVHPLTFLPGTHQIAYMVNRSMNTIYDDDFVPVQYTTYQDHQFPLFIPAHRESTAPNTQFFHAHEYMTPPPKTTFTGNHAQAYSKKMRFSRWLGERFIGYSTQKVFRPVPCLTKSPLI